MTVRFLLDSNIISEPSRPIPNTQVLDQLNRYRSEVAVASLVVHEILYGCWRLPASKRKDSLWKYIKDSVLDLPVFDYDLKAAKWHAQERSRLSKIAFCNDLILVTNNMADFQDFEDLIIENWFITVD
jgi:tRNA(fMet)-specific endonuclease VapC